MNMRRICTTILISLLNLPSPAGAANGPFSDTEIDARFETATNLLDSQETNAEYWEYGWGAFDTGTMIWSIAQAGNEPDLKARRTDIVQASESLIGLADVIFRPLPAFNADSICPLGAATDEEEQKCIAAKEQLLEESTERARDPYEILPHLGNAGFNLLAGVIVSRLGGTGRALATAIPGEIIGELQLWTTPSGPIDDYRQYRIRFSPMLAETGHPQSPAGGVQAFLSF